VSNDNINFVYEKLVADLPVTNEPNCSGIPYLDKVLNLVNTLLRLSFLPWMERTVTFFTSLETSSHKQGCQRLVSYRTGKLLPNAQAFK